MEHVKKLQIRHPLIKHHSVHYINLSDLVFRNGNVSHTYAFPFVPPSGKWKSGQGAPCKDLDFG